MATSKAFNPLKLVRVAGLCLLLIASSLSNASKPKVLTIPPLGALEPPETTIFYEQALLLALAKTTPEFSEPDYQLAYYPRIVGRERYRLLLKRGDIDVIWSSSNQQREQEFVAVKFNLLRGINEYRRLLIRADDQEKFDRVKNLEDLQQFKIGSGTHWSDTTVYEFNNLPLVTAYAYSSMFRMLAAKRFDYMARSLQEVDKELNDHQQLGLAIEKNLLIHYPQPIYFFLKRDNSALAERIEKGLKLAQADGSLNALFRSIAPFRAAEEQLQQLKLRVIELQRED